MQHTITTASTVLDRLAAAHAQIAALSSLTAGDILAADQFAADTAASLTEFRRDSRTRVFTYESGRIDLDYYFYCEESEFSTLIEMADVSISSDEARVSRTLDVRDDVRVTVVLEAPMPLDYIDTLASMGKIVTQTQEYKSLVC
jgi:hypothetical protein